jgi:phosphoribosylglycinamide formyltransferase 1
MRILTPEFVGLWQGRMLNIHPSLLPKYKGLHTHQRAIEAGDKYAGCSVHLVTAELDDGPVLGQTEVAILNSDDEDSLAARVLFAEHQLYSRCLADYVGRELDAGWLLEKIRTLALALPQSSERESHGAPGWRAGSEKTGKFFAYFADELLALVENQPDIYFKPAYYGASGWVGIILNRAGVDWDHVSEWLERSWRTVAPKSLTKMMDVADQF